MIAHERAKAYNLSLIEAIFSTIHGGITGGMFLVGLLMFLGGGNFEIGMLSAIPALTSVFSILSVMIVRRWKSRKKISLWCFLTSRITFGFILGLVFVRLPASPIIMLILVAISSAFGSINGTVWLSWITGVIPQRVWGRYFSRRSIISSISGMAVPLIAGKILDYFKLVGHQASGFALLWGVGLVVTIVSYIILTKIPENELVSTDYKPIVETLVLPLTDKNFLPFLRLGLFFTFFNSFAGPFYVPHMLNNLGMSFFEISFYGLIAGLIGLYFRNLWGKLIDRYGNRAILKSSLWGIFPLPLLWLFPTPHFYLPIWVDAFLTGIFWTGVDIGLLTLLLSLSQNSERESYYTFYTLATGLATFLGSLAGGTVAKATSHFQLNILGKTIVNYHLLFMTSSLSRLITIQLALRIPEKRRRDVLSPGIFPILHDELWKLVGNFARTAKSALFLVKEKFENHTK